MDMRGKTVLITGSTDGVGRYVPSDLPRRAPMSWSTAGMQRARKR